MPKTYLNDKVWHWGVSVIEVKTRLIEILRKANHSNLKLRFINGKKTANSKLNTAGWLMLRRFGILTGRIPIMGPSSRAVLSTNVSKYGFRRTVALSVGEMIEEKGQVFGKKLINIR